MPESASALAPWAGACEQGLAVLPPLLELLGVPEPEVARNAKRALQDIVRHAGRPNAARYAEAVEGHLLDALDRPSAAYRADVVWLLSEIGGRRSVPRLEELLQDPDLREHARCALARIPLARAAKALEAARKDAEGDWKQALTEALRSRGYELPATAKLSAVAKTEVRPRPVK